MSPLLNNRYQILEVLGIGGCGQTFLASDTHMPSNRRCVVKQLKPATTDPLSYQIIQERFRREAALLETLGRANNQIPTLYAYFTEGKDFYLVQDWIDGHNLRQKVSEEGPLDEAAVRNLLVSLLPVLQYVHSKGIIHRDIKPDNIMLRSEDDEPVLIDFGAVKEIVATVVDSEGGVSSIVIGSPGFMPVEQAAGRPVFASDLFSLGLTAIYLLTGKLPQELTDPSSGEISWRRHAGSISAKMAILLDKAIEPLARDRYQSAQAMLDALQPETPTLAVTSRQVSREVENESKTEPIILPQTEQHIGVAKPVIEKPRFSARSVIAVVVSYIAMFVLNFLGLITLYTIVGPRQAFKPRSFLASNRWIAMGVAVMFITGIIAGLLCAAIARGRKATLALAVLILAVGLVLAIPAIMKGRANAGMARVGDVPAMEAAEKAYWPVWVPFAFPFISAAGAFVGGRLKKRS